MIYDKLIVKNRPLPVSKRLESAGITLPAPTDLRENTRHATLEKIAVQALCIVESADCADKVSEEWADVSALLTDKYLLQFFFAIIAMSSDDSGYYSKIANSVSSKYIKNLH